MIPRNKYLITPHGKEYKNTKNIDGHSLIVNTSIENVKYVNRVGLIISAPKDSEIPNGSLVVVHHNVFRTYLDMKGRQRKSNEYFRDEKYLVGSERIYMYNDGEGWKCTEGYVFVSPYDYIQNDRIYQSNEKEEEHMGLIRHSSLFPKGTRVGFTKNSEYEFELGGEKMYRMKLSDICVKFT